MNEIGESPGGAGPEPVRKPAGTARRETPGEGLKPAPEPWRKHRVQFTGDAGEYFRIWIVNSFLTILTFGIYAAWAKVRTRQYFYAHTRILGHSFEYLADPVRILRGNLLVGAGFALFVTADLVGPLFKLGVMALIGLLTPFFIHKSLRFLAHNTAFRNIRFRFTGSLWEAYKTYLFWPVLLVLSLGLLAPSWLYRRKRYFFGNFAFGDTANRFRGELGFFYRHYCMGILLGMLVMTVLMTLSAVAPMLTAAGGDAPGTPSPNAVLGTVLVSYAVALLGFSVVDQYLQAQFTNHCWKRSRLGAIRFDSRLDPGELIKIRVTNILAILFSFGLLAPWAKVRRARYVLSRLCLGTRGEFPLLRGASGAEEGALGEAAVGLMDIDIGF